MERGLTMAGKLVHFEIPAKDTSRAKKFYSSLFGWEFEAIPGPVEYHMLKGDTQPGGAIYPATQAGSDLPKIYFEADEIDQTIRKVRQLGGKAEEKQPVPSMGWFTECQDTEGNKFSLWQNDPTAAAQEREAQAETPVQA
jgi:predicted enzyme related to lactoylglutathione lyase